MLGLPSTTRKKVCPLSGRELVRLPPGHKQGMASRKPVYKAYRRLSWRVGLPLLAFVCYASATVAPAPVPRALQAPTALTTAASSSVVRGSSSSASSAIRGGVEAEGSGGDGSSLSLSAILAIVGAVAACVGVGAVVLLYLHKKKKDKKNRVRNDLLAAGLAWGDVAAEEGESRSRDRSSSEREFAMPARSATSSAPPSRSASLALVAPFDGRPSWLTTGDGLDVELGGGGGALGAEGGGDQTSMNGSTIGPRHANPLYGVNRGLKDRTAAVAAATASPSDMEEEAGGCRRGFGATGGSHAGSGGTSEGSSSVALNRTTEGGSATAATGDEIFGGSGASGASGSGGTNKNETENESEHVHENGNANGNANGNGNGNGNEHGNENENDPVVKDGRSTRSAANSGEEANGPTAPVVPSRRSSTPVPVQQVHPEPEQGSSIRSNPLHRRSVNDGGSEQSRSRRGRRNSASSLTSFSVRSSAEGVVAGAQSLSPLEAFVPGAKETLGVVAGLARLAAADHRGDAKDMRRRVRWCKGVVMTLDRARAVLGKAAEDDVEAKREVLEAVKEPVGCMVEIVQSYKNKHVVSEVFSSSLFRRRQTEADEAVVFAERLLSALEESSGHQHKISEAIRAKAERVERRRQSVLQDQVDIPAAALDVIEREVLGVGGFGTVYLADLGGGLNAAVKVVVFRPVHKNEGDDDDDDDDDSTSSNEAEQLQREPAPREGTGVPERSHRIYMESPKVTLGAGAGGQGGEGVGFTLAAVDPVDQKARRRAVVAKARRAARQARTGARQRQAFVKELEAMKRLRGPHTVHTYGAVITLDRLVLVMEFMPGGDLLLRLRKAKRPLEGPVLRRIVRDICSGLAFLHAENFVHGDLKSANVLFDAKGRAKIADLGTSLWTQCTSRVATYSSRPGGLMSLPWAAPEVLRRQGATSKSDVYSFGVVLWECLSRRVPWEDVTDVKLLSSSVKRGERPAVPEDAPADLADLARLCWAGDPYERPTLDRVLADVLDAAHDAAGAVDAAVP
ncbi:unnamed protein product [Pylaiella littoralis]